MDNNSTTETTQVKVPQADLRIALSDDVDPVQAGSALVYIPLKNSP